MKRSIRSMALAMTAVFFLGSMAEAHLRVENTHLKLTVSDKTIKKGTEVHFKGVLSSAWDKCYASRPVKLIRNGVVRRSKKTNADGIVKFSWHLRATGLWQLKFKGRRWGPHPAARHVCKPSQSNVVKITVTNP